VADDLYTLRLRAGGVALHVADAAHPRLRLRRRTACASQAANNV
jgi:hypothetical protein